MPPKTTMKAGEKALEGVWDDTWVEPGRLIWVETPTTTKYDDVFVAGTVKSYDKNTKKAVVEYGEVKKKGPSEVRIDRFVERSPKFVNLADLVDVEILNDAELLNNMLEKFKIYDIFTYCGPTLLVTNPILPKFVLHFFTDDVMKEYCKMALQESFNIKDKPPHIWAISAQTYWQLFANGKKQAMCISGESGAGKTVNARFAMKFMTFMSSFGDTKPKPAQVEGAEKVVSIEDKILACNPILEAFGNSRTVRNDNSSRFGKYVALICKIAKVKSESKIVGAVTTNYLLEKSRIIQQAQKERNYHIFYQCMYGLPEETLKKYNFENFPAKYEILNKTGGVYKVDTVDDVKEFKEVTKSFVDMKFSEEEVDMVYSIVGSVLNLGNVFIDDSAFEKGGYCKVVDDDTYLPLVCQNLQMDINKLKKSLVTGQYVVTGQIKEKALDKTACIQLRDSLAKDLFEKLFNWLVKRLNVTILPEEDKVLGGQASNKKDRMTIGLLDIFGFEIFDVNSLEQFCINFTNENLHQLYISYVFKSEEIVFKEEGLGDAIGKELTFSDNQNIIDLLSKGSKCVLSLLNESTRNPKDDPIKNDTGFLANIKNFCGKDPNFYIPKFKTMEFTIIHTARDVEYNVTNFVAKNQDSLSALLVDCILTAGKKQLGRVYKNILSDEDDVAETDDGDKNKKFLAYKFNQQMYDLMDELKSCECNFMRCIKPNEDKKVGEWDPVLAIGQIRYLGILDSIKIRKTSYPFRRDFKAFYKRYQDLDPVGSRMPFKKHEENPSTDWKALCKAVHKSAIPEYGDSQILFGNNRVFVRFEANLKLEQIYQIKLQKKKEAVATIGPFIKFFERKEMFVKVTKDTIKLTKILRDLVVGWRSKIFYRKFRMLKAITLKIQRRWRYKLYLRNHRYVRTSARMIAASFTTRGLTDERRKKLKAAAHINRIGRGYMARMERREKLKFKIMTYAIFEDVWKVIDLRIKNKAALKIQKVYRGYIVRKQNKEVVDKIKKTKEDFIYNSAATKIQKVYRGRIMRKRYLRILAATSKIQGFFRTVWLSAMFQRLRKSTIKIQIRIRRYLIRKQAKEKIMKRYMEAEGNTLYDIQELEHSCLIEFAGGLKESDQKEKGRGAPQETHDGFLLSAIPDKSKFQTSKLYLWMFILDIDCMTELTDVYEPIWTEQYKTLLVEIGKRSSELQMLEVGSMHSMVISNKNHLYSWGMNDYGQLSRNLPTNDDESYTVDLVSVPKRGDAAPKIKNFSSGDDFGVFVSKEGEVFVTGRNDKGQLGLSNDQDVNQFTLHETLTNVDVFKVIVAKGYHSVAIGESGKAYYWPAKLSELETLCEPIRLSFPEETKITMASCGYDFVMLLSSRGVLFTMGRNIEGQLGLGLNRKDQSEPVPIQYLLNEKQKITSVSCGFRHSAALGSNGRVFTWGWGDRGQLGNGTKYSFSEPRAIKFPPKVIMSKVLQVRSGYRSCIALMEDLSMYWWGTNGSLRQELSPIKVKNKELVDENLTPAKVATAWSKSMNITYCTIVDSRKIEISKSSKVNIISNLASSWENCHQDIEPPIPESISKYFAGKNLGTSSARKADGQDFQKMMKTKQKNSELIKEGLEVSKVATRFVNNLKEIGEARKSTRPVGTSQAFSTPVKSSMVKESSVKTRAPVSSQASPPAAKPERTEAFKKSPGLTIKHKAQPSVFDQHKKTIQAKSVKQATTAQAAWSPKKVQNKILEEVAEPSLETKLREIKYQVDIIKRKPPSKWTKDEREFVEKSKNSLMMDLLSALALDD